MYWSLPQWQSQETLRHTRLDSIVRNCPDQTGSLLKPKVNLTSVTRNMHLSAGTREPLLHMFLSSLHTESRALHTRINATDKRAKKKKEANPPLTCDPGHKGVVLHAYRGASRKVYDCIISPAPHHLSTHQWTLEATTLEQADQASLIHLPPRCLCQVIAGRKRKTDQYISHGPDR